MLYKLNDRIPLKIPKWFSFPPFITCLEDHSFTIFEDLADLLNTLNFLSPPDCFFPLKPPDICLSIMIWTDAATHSLVVSLSESFLSSVNAYMLGPLSNPISWLTAVSD